MQTCRRELNPKVWAFGAQPFATQGKESCAPTGAAGWSRKAEHGEGS
jgi:hypothetical protein